MENLSENWRKKSYKYLFFQSCVFYFLYMKPWVKVRGHIEKWHPSPPKRKLVTTPNKLETIQ